MNNENELSHCCRRNTRGRKDAPKRQPDDAERNALDESQWSAMETTSKALRSLAKRLCPFRQVAGLWHPGEYFSALKRDADTENLSIDSTCIKVHESSNGWEKAGNKAVGRTKGGLNTKIYAIVDGLGNPVAFLLSPGNDNDFTHTIELMRMTDISGSNLLGDKAYGTKEILT